MIKCIQILQQSITSCKIIASWSADFPVYWLHSRTGKKYGGELHITMQCFWIETIGSRFAVNSSKHCRAVASPSAIFAWDSPLPPTNLKNNFSHY